MSVTNTWYKWWAWVYFLVGNSYLIVDRESGKSRNCFCPLNKNSQLSVDALRNIFSSCFWDPFHIQWIYNFISFLNHLIFDIFYLLETWFWYAWTHSLKLLRIDCPSGEAQLSAAGDELDLARFEQLLGAFQRGSILSTGSDDRSFYSLLRR